MHEKNRFEKKTTDFIGVSGNFIETWGKHFKQRQKWLFTVDPGSTDRKTNSSCVTHPHASTLTSIKAIYNGWHSCIKKRVVGYIPLKLHNISNMSTQCVQNCSPSIPFKRIDETLFSLIHIQRKWSNWYRIHVQCNCIKIVLPVL